MQYRHFPLIQDHEVSALGLGCMRLPVRDGKDDDIDQAAVEDMFRAAAEAGINYVDTAYGYHRGKSEAAVGAALDATGLRGKFTIATKSPVWLVKDEGDWDRLLDEQLKRLGAESIDFYLFHALSGERWETVVQKRGLEAMERAKKDGRIRHLGFSFHDNLDAFKKIIDACPDWEFCQIQYNYVDRDFQAGQAGIAYAAEREIGVIVMEPLRGGSLAQPPFAVREALNKYPKPRHPSEWALRFALERQEVATVLSGMGTVDQIWNNAAVADAARANSLTRAEMAALDEARAIFKSREKVPCTGCGYCQPCPSKVAIPSVFELYNSAEMFGTKKDRASWYNAAYLSAGKGADVCTKCGVCVAKCPQHIEIPSRLEEAHAYLTS